MVWILLNFWPFAGAASIPSNPEKKEIFIEILFKWEKEEGIRPSKKKELEHIHF